MDIYAEILEALKRKGLTRITRVSYAVGLPVDRTKNFLKDLSSSGLVAMQPGVDSGYSITHRGLEFLDAYWKLQGFLDFIGREVQHLMAGLSAETCSGSKIHPVHLLRVGVDQN